MKLLEEREFRLTDTAPRRPEVDYERVARVVAERFAPPSSKGSEKLGATSPTMGKLLVAINLCFSVRLSKYIHCV
jgi:hypothetical protein